MKYFYPLFPFLAGCLLLLVTKSFAQVTLANAFLQSVLFLLVVCIPIWRTGRLSYVDIGWPLGLSVIGVVTLLMSEGYWFRNTLVSLIYIFMGGRMGLGAINLWRLGKLKRELPRYEYQKLRWEKSCKTNRRLVMQIEGILQGAANASFLALPAFVIAANPTPSFSVIEIVGLTLWLIFYTSETIADLQKARFLKTTKKRGERNRVCNVGLWRLCRHPNYFSEWMVWNALVVAAVPSWLALYGREPFVIWGLIGLGLLYVSKIMYTTLVHYTGAVPSEYYSLEKRPEYKEYQRTTSRFFPAFFKRV